MIRNILLVAVRNFLRHPGHSFLNVIGLSVGFTCAFLTLIWVSNEFSFDKFHHEPGNIYKVLTHVEANGSYQTFDAASAAMDIISVPEVKDRVMISSGSRWPHELCFHPDEKAGECVYMNGIFSSASFFSFFNYPVLMGDQNPLREPASIALSNKLAQRMYGKEDPIGRIIKIDGHFPVTITSTFEDVPSNSSLQFDFVMPMAVFKSLRGMNEETFSSQFFSTYIRTGAPVELTSLTARLNDNRVLTENLKKDKLSYQAYPFTEWRLKSKFEDGKSAGGRIEYVRIFVIIALLVIVLTVINFVNLSTARATTRAKEIGIRKVTGAHRSGIVLQFFSESFLVVLLAFILAAGITQWTLPYFGALLAEPLAMNLFSGWLPVYLLTGLLLVALFAGIYPAFVMSSFEPIKVLKYQAGGLSGSQRLRKILLMVQLSVSIGILIFSGVIYLQLNFIVNKNLGFDRDNMIRVEPTYRMLKQFETFKTEMLKDPDILAVATSSANPLDLQAQNNGVKWPGKPDDMQVTFQTFGCSYEFPELMGLSLLEGRFFNSQSLDSINNEVMVSEDAVRTMGMKNPVGGTLYIGDVPCVIIGVVNNFHTRSLREARMPVILFRSTYVQTSAVFIKYRPGTTQKSLEALTGAYNVIEPDFTMKYWFQDETFDKQYKTEWVALRLVLLFTFIALFSAVIGIIGMATFNVLRRVKEIGIRRVFGATVVQIMNQLTNEFGLIMLAAVLVASPAAWYATDRWLSGFVYHVTMPWWLYAVCFSGIAVLTISIICIQGFKTIVTNPTETLRSE